MNTTKKNFTTRIFIAILISISSIFCSGCSKKTDTKNTDNEILYPISINRKYGFINYEGEIKIPCTYDSVSDFNEDGICKVSEGENYFYINKKNKIVKKYKGKTEHVDPYIICNDNSERKLQPDTVPAGLKISCPTPCIGEKMFTVCNIEDDYYVGVIDTNGNIIVPTILFGIGCFKNGMAPFKYGHRGVDGYLRKDGVIFDFSNWK